MKCTARVPRSRSSSPSRRPGILSVLKEQCGTPQSPKLLGSPEVSPAHLKQGAAVYARYCVQCHGVIGRRQRRRRRVPAAQAPRLSPRDLQVHLHDLRVEAAPRGPDPHRPQGDSRDLDAGVQPAAARRPGGRRGLRPGPHSPGRARERAGRGGRGLRRGRRCPREGADRHGAQPMVAGPRQGRLPDHADARVHARHRRAGQERLPHPHLPPVPRRGRPRPDGDQRRDRCLGQSHQGGRPDLRHAPRRHRAAGHLPAHRRGHQRHPHAVVPRHAQQGARTHLAHGRLCAQDRRQPSQRPDARIRHARREWHPQAAAGRPLAGRDRDQGGTAPAPAPVPSDERRQQRVTFHDTH